MSWLGDEEEGHKSRNHSWLLKKMSSSKEEEVAAEEEKETKYIWGD